MNRKIKIRSKYIHRKSKKKQDGVIDEKVEEKQGEEKQGEEVLPPLEEPQLNENRKKEIFTEIIKILETNEEYKIIGDNPYSKILRYKDKGEEGDYLIIQLQEPPNSILFNLYFNNDPSHIHKYYKIKEDYEINPLINYINKIKTMYFKI